jgi:hypothetical protein
MVLTYDPPSGQIDMTQLQNLVQLFQAHGGLTQWPDLAKMVESEFIASAVGRLGPYK